MYQLSKPWSLQEKSIHHRFRQFQKNQNVSWQKFIKTWNYVKLSSNLIVKKLPKIIELKWSTGWLKSLLNSTCQIELTSWQSHALTNTCSVLKKFFTTMKSIWLLLAAFLSAQNMRMLFLCRPRQYPKKFLMVVSLLSKSYKKSMRSWLK
jgi:hypothetical protein